MGLFVLILCVTGLQSVVTHMGIMSVTSTPQTTFLIPTKFQLPPNYNKDERPGRRGETTLVAFEIHVQAINPIKASDMDFRMELVLSLTWTDPRLVFPDPFYGETDRFVLPNEFVDQIWHPDPFFANAKSTEVGSLSQRLVNVYIYKNQTVIYSINLFATIACAMQFQFYPYDFQLCPTVIESFSYEENLVKYVWSRVQPFTINPKLRLLQFVVTYPLRVEECTVTRAKESRKYSQLVAYFRFDRLLGNHLIQNFAPCSLIVSLTWLSFWLELDAVSARVSLIVTSMLTLVTQFTGLKVDFPPVAYAKAVDLWMAMCLCFVFAALGEFVVVKVIFSLTEDAKAVEQANKEQRINSGTNGNQEENLRTPLEPDMVSSPTVVPFLNEMNEMDQMDRNGTLKEEPPAPAPSLVGVTKPKGLSCAPKALPHRLSDLDPTELTYTLRGTLRLPLVYTDVRTGRRHVLWRDIDYLCRWGFPVAFCACVSIYWLILFIHSRLNSPEHKPHSYCA